MVNEELHPVRFSKGQVDFIEHLILICGKATLGDWPESCCDILSTIEKSEKESSKPLTEGKTLSNVKEQPTTRAPSGPPPPGQGESKPNQGESEIKRCYHLNMRFIRGMDSGICPDCHKIADLSDVINILLDLLHVHPTH